MGSYENYDAVLGGILDVARVPGFLTNLDANGEINEAEGQRRGMVNLWWSMFKDRAVTPMEIYTLLGEADLIGEEFGETYRKFVHQVSRMVDQVYAGKKIVRDAGADGKPRYDRKNAPLYRLKPLGDA